AGAVVVIGVAIVVFSGGSSPPASHHGDAGGSPHSGSSGTAGASLTGFFIKSSTPATGAQDVASNASISVTFSEPVVLGKAAPSISPAFGGKWVMSGKDTLTYQLDSPLVPSSHVVVTIPGGPSGVRSANGAKLSGSTTVSFDVVAGDELRLQQLLAGLNFLPVSFAPSGPAPSRADLAVDQAGAFAWRWPDMPSELTSMWTQGTDNEITRAAVEAFETQNNLTVDGIAGPAVWTALINDTLNGKSDATPYVYVLVNKALPENLTLWNNGAGEYVGIPVNTGIPGADTTDGSYAVFEHVRYSDMKGTNVDGSTYNDPNVPYASYFNGGDALHGFIRSSYGSPQSNGCVEMSYADAALVYPLTPIGTLVTVVGPNYGSAPPPTTTTTTTSTVPPPPTTTTTTAPPPPAASTTTVPPSTGNTPPG
ncbi:MAG TPA: Ig-like domain-containing protein, partial [Acidimicrobiales bacterium]|nr:Ig-like domain-containing protein [Acidimicrobiales bacterium]